MKKTNLLNFIHIFLIFIFITSFQNHVLADDFFYPEPTDFSNFQTLETFNNSFQIPTINAKHAIVIDRFSNQILFGKKEKEKCKMASTTKIMTCIIALENSSLDSEITISQTAASINGSRLGLKKEDKITLKHLLYGLMLCSGNDAAIAIAEHISGNTENFANLMNQKALDLNLKSTHFVTPHGLDNDNHYTSAYDLAVLTNYALKNEIFSEIVSTKNYTVTINGHPKIISNTNELLGNYNGIYGVKTGFTNGANRCLVTSCRNKDLDIICIVLGCDTKKNRTQDSINLLNYVLNNFQTINIEEFLDDKFKDWYFLHSNSFTINKGTSNILKLKLDKSSLPYSKMAIKKSDKKNLDVLISFNTQFESPIFQNSKIGTITLIENNKVYFSLQIINTNHIYRKTVFYYFNKLLSNYSIYFKNGT